LEIIQFVINQLPEHTDLVPAIKAAVYANHVDVVDYFLKNGCDCPPYIVMLVIFSGNNEMIDCLKRYKLI
jgi:hypothetical protein